MFGKPSYLWALAALAAAACGEPDLTTRSACANNFDCSPDEICSSGYCLPRTLDPPVVQPDAGTVTQPDARTSVPDAGMSSLDGAVGDPDASPGIPDSGCAVIAMIVGGGGYCTITEAIAASVNGDVVQVAAGSFSEAIDINKSITVGGAGVSGTTLTGPGTAPVVRASVQNVTLEGMTLQGANGYGIEVLGTMTGTNLAIQGAAGAGVRVRNSGASVTLTDVHISAVVPNVDQFAFGVDLGAGTSGTLTRCTIEDATYVGVEISGATAIIRESTVTRCGRSTCGGGSLDNCAPGIDAWMGSSLTLEQTVVRESGLSGVYLEGGQLVMRGSSSLANGIEAAFDAGYLTDGVSLTEGTQANIQDSELSDNWGFGLGCWGAAPSVSGNNIAHTGNYAWTNCP